ncbi:hypothetical protein M885DRAFT_127108 [Pelagophyceae sp. CCMP2097]|nr:hypothetical protein M885DRAFT_127108 [Pelagophyceae sp. CCMP2097]
MRDKLAELEANIAKTAKPAAATKPGSRREQKFARSLRTWDDDIALDEAHASFGRGAARFLTFREFESSEECLAALRAVEDLKVWTTDLGQEAVVLAAGAPWLEAEGLPEQLALVIGTESTGVSNLFHDAADKRVYLPLNGFADSLNVGVATALALQTILQLYGKDACGDLIDPPAKAPRIYTAETAKPGVLRAAWARYLSRDEKQHAAVVASLESEVPLLDDLRRAEAFREHNGRNLANDKSAKHQARLAANAALNKVC